MALEKQVIVTTEQMRNQSAEVKTLLNEMKNRFGRLEETIKGTSAYWSGEAGEAHRKQYMSRINLVEEMLARYLEHVTDLEKMAGVYETAEAAAEQAGDALPMSTLD